MFGQKLLDQNDRLNKKAAFLLKSKKNGFGIWWRRGESNSGPYWIFGQALQAYSAIKVKGGAVR